MGRREDFFTTIRHVRPERTPFSLSLCDALQEVFYQRTGSINYCDYFDIPFREVKPKPSKSVPDYAPYYEAIAHVDATNEWGVGKQKSNFYHYYRFIPVMATFTTPEQVWEYPLPDILEDYRWENCDKEVEALKKRDYVVVSGGVNIDIFEPAWYLRGMENLLTDFYMNPDIAAACLDRLVGVKEKIAKRFAEIGVDVIVYGDDVGDEKSLLLQPSMWREWLKPRLKRLINAAKSVNPEVLCYYHSDGNIESIIPDLIEIGVDILNPIQPESMDPKKVKRLYGDRLVFWGTVGIQTLMPFGTPQEVREQVGELIDTVGENGGFVISPTHILQPEVPWENIETFVETVKQHQ